MFVCLCSTASENGLVQKRQCSNTDKVLTKRKYRFNFPYLEMYPPTEVIKPCQVNTPITFSDKVGKK